MTGKSISVVATVLMFRPDVQSDVLHNLNDLRISVTRGPDNPKVFVAHVTANKNFRLFRGYRRTGIPTSAAYRCSTSNSLMAIARGTVLSGREGRRQVAPRDRWYGSCRKYVR
jgi:hypothetical protein